MFRSRFAPPISPTRPAPQFLDDSFEGHNAETSYPNPYSTYEYQDDEEIEDSLGEEESHHVPSFPPVDLMSSRVYSTSLRTVLGSSDDEGEDQDQDWIEEEEARFAEEAAATASADARATSHLHSAQEQFLESSNIFAGPLSARKAPGGPASVPPVQAAPAGCTRVADCVPREYCSVFPFLNFNRVQSGTSNPD